VRTDLWRIGSIAITLLDVFYGVNNGCNAIKFIDNFVDVFQSLVAKDAALREEMVSGERYKRAMELQKARQGAQ
jgi:hypothetical protein